MQNNEIIHGDSLEVLKRLTENSIDSVVTDPPYELGFMGKKWDSTGIANNVDLWKEVLRVLKPGGHLLSFGGTRTYHRMACAIEDAGFEVRDMIEWVYGSGFPKSLNIGKAVDKIQGNEREIVGKEKGAGTTGDNQVGNQTFVAKNQYEDGTHDITKGNSPWEGWGTALKPAHEPICMARKPLAEKTVAENVLTYGTGGINIDASRVEGVNEADKNSWKTNRKTDGGSGWSFRGETSPEQNTQGRFPANLIHDNSEEVRECFPDTKSGVVKNTTNNFNGSNNINMGGGILSPENSYGDSGNASRFFKSIIYQAKASKSERNKGCEGLEDVVDRPFQERLLAQCKVCGNKGLKVGAGKQFTCGHTGIEYVKTEYKPSSNNHPTVKPTELMRYLCRLITPPRGTVLDPFMGSGSTGRGAVLEGFRFIGIEKEVEYVNIANARVQDAINNVE